MSPCDVKKLTYKNYDESIVKMLPGEEVDIEIKDKSQKRTESIQKSIM